MSDGRLNKWWSQATVVGKTVLFFRAPGFRLSPRCKVASRNLKIVPSDFQKRVQASKQASKHLACLLACLLSGSNSCSVGAGRGEGRAHVMRKVFKKHSRSIQEPHKYSRSMISRIQASWQKMRVPNAGPQRLAPAQAHNESPCRQASYPNTR